GGDAQAGGQLRHVLVDRHLRLAQAYLCIHGGQVAIDRQTHGYSPSFKSTHAGARLRSIKGPLCLFVLRVFDFRPVTGIIPATGRRAGRCYWSSLRAWLGFWLAWASIAMPAWVSTWLRARSAETLATSASWMRLLAALRLVANVWSLLSATDRRF